MSTAASRADLVAHLEQGIERLTTSEVWRSHLELQSRFHRYRTGRSGLFQRGECLQRQCSRAGVQC